MIRINVTVEVKSEVRAQVVELLREMSELSRQEKGCIGYEILENNRLDNVLMIIETWENETLLAVHKGSDHFGENYPGGFGNWQRKCVARSSRIWQP